MRHSGTELVRWASIQWSHVSPPSSRFAEAYPRASGPLAATLGNLSHPRPVYDPPSSLGTGPHSPCR